MMGIDWKPDRQLTATLVECGIDLDIIEGTLASSLDLLVSNNPLALAREFTQIVIDQHISWSNTKTNEAVEDLTLFIEPQSYMRKGWRPKEKTTTLLTDILNLTDRIDLGFLREWFIRSNEGHLARSWDSLFIRYTFACYEEQKSIEEEKKISKKTSSEQSLAPYPEEQRLKNITAIKSIIADLLKTIYVTPFFNKPLDDTWQPAKWVVQKLQKRFNLSKRFIFDRTILRPFVSFHNAKGKMFDDYNTLYFHWVLKRFRAHHKHLLEEKSRIEKIINENNQRL